MTSTEQLMATAVTALASAVVFLFFWFKNHFDKLTTRQEECERDRLELWKQLIRLASQSCSDVTCDERQPLTSLEQVAIDKLKPSLAT